MALEAPISIEELEKINRYVERARRLKGAFCSDRAPKPLQLSACLTGNDSRDMFSIVGVLQAATGVGRSSDHCC